MILVSLLIRTLNLIDAFNFDKISSSVQKVQVQVQVQKRFYCQCTYMRIHIQKQKEKEPAELKVQSY